MLTSEKSLFIPLSLHFELGQAPIFIIVINNSNNNKAFNFIALFQKLKDALFQMFLFFLS